MCKELDPILTDRELEIAKLVLCGCTNKDICNKLGVKRATINNHLSSVYKKLDIHKDIQILKAMVKTHYIENWKDLKEILNATETTN